MRDRAEQWRGPVVSGNSTAYAHNRCLCIRISSEREQPPGELIRIASSTYEMKRRRCFLRDARIDYRGDSRSAEGILVPLKIPQKALQSLPIPFLHAAMEFITKSDLYLKLQGNSERLKLRSTGMRLRAL